MAARELDISIIPIFEALRNPEYRILPGTCIACDGPTRSVKLFSLKPLDEIRSVLLDRSSLTSVHLAQILLPGAVSQSVQYRVSERPILPADQVTDHDVDAAVVIGDTALAWEGTFPVELDLGEEWKRQTGLPFVFAAWVARPGVPLSQPLLQAFIDARQRGERDVYDIARRVTGEDSARLMSLVDYLSRAIKYRLGPAEREAIERYAEKLRAGGHLAGKPVLNFVELDDRPSGAAGLRTGAEPGNL